MQFMKAGIAEIPHIVVVTKADMGAAARRARADVKGALGLTETGIDWQIPVLLVSAALRDGVPAVVEAINSHAEYLTPAGLAAARHGQAANWLIDAVRERFGREGVRRAGDLTLARGESPFRRLATLAGQL